MLSARYLLLGRRISVVCISIFECSLYLTVPERGLNGMTRRKEEDLKTEQGLKMGVGLCRAFLQLPWCASYTVQRSWYTGAFKLWNHTIPVGYIFLWAVTVNSNVTVCTVSSFAPWLSSFWPFNAEGSSQGEVLWLLLLSLFASTY